MEVVELKVHLHCKACEKSVRRALRQLKGVTCVEINVISNKITVLGYIDQNTIVKAIRETGRVASESSYCRPCGSNSNYSSPFRCSASILRRPVSFSNERRRACKKAIKAFMEEDGISNRKSKVSDRILKAMCFKGKRVT